MSDQENLLERALRLAATDAVFIPEFYGTLLDSDVFVIGREVFAEEDDLVQDNGNAGERLQIQEGVCSDGSSFIPFFSFLAALECYIDDDENYMKVKARFLFQVTLGEDLILNPASEYAKSFTAFEVGDLLRHGLPQHGRTEVVEEQSRVLIGQPSDYPRDITETLARFFASEPRVKAAYLVLMHVLDRDESPSLYVGIECDPADYDSIHPAAGVVVSHLLTEDRPLSFCPVFPEMPETLADYMLNETEPFYRALPEGRQSRREKTPAAARHFGMRPNVTYH